MSLASLVTSHFEELKRELDGFTELFLEWTDQRRRVLMDDKEAYLRTLSEEQDTVEALKKQYQQLVLQKQNILNALDAEQAEREEYAKQNHEYLLQRDLFKQKLSALRKEREQLEDEIIKESKIQQQRERVREISRGQRQADLELYRAKLGFELLSDDHKNCTTFIFSKIDPKNPERKFHFTMDYSDGLNFRLAKCHPILASHQSLLEQLNKHRNFLQFICQMRASFVDSLK